VAAKDSEHLSHAVHVGTPSLDLLVPCASDFLALGVFCQVIINQSAKQPEVPERIIDEMVAILELLLHSKDIWVDQETAAPQRLVHAIRPVIGMVKSDAEAVAHDYLGRRVEAVEIFAAYVRFWRPVFSKSSAIGIAKEVHEAPAVRPLRVIVIRTDEADVTSIRVGFGQIALGAINTGFDIKVTNALCDEERLAATVGREYIAGAPERVCSEVLPSSKPGVQVQVEGRGGNR
jgi:hypothetical protein